MARASSVGRDIPGPGAVKTTLFIRLKLTVALEMPGSSEIICWEMSCGCWAGPGLLGPSDTGTAGTDLPPLPLAAQFFDFGINFQCNVNLTKSSHCSLLEGEGLA